MRHAAALAAAAATLALLSLAACREGGAATTPMQRVAGGDPALGPDIMVSYGCGSCHVIPGVPAAVGRTGPPLTDFAERAYIAGRVPNEPDALVRWIVAPPSIDPETVMPALGLTLPEARHVAAYLYTLRSRSLGPPHLLPVGAIPGH